MHTSDAMKPLKCMTASIHQVWRNYYGHNYAQVIGCAHACSMGPTGACMVVSAVNCCSVTTITIPRLVALVAEAWLVNKLFQHCGLLVCKMKKSEMTL